jgi:alpha-galactosidase
MTALVTFSINKRLAIMLHHNDRLIGQAVFALWRNGQNLLDAPMHEMKIGKSSASGTFSLANDARLRLNVTLRESNNPQAATVIWTLANTGKTPLSFDRLCAPTLGFNNDAFGPDVWTLQGAAVHWGQDFAFELSPGFSRDNFLGHLQNAEGGGIPLAYFWDKEYGIALMHTETQPKDWYMPVKSNSTGIETAFELRKSVTLNPAESIESLQIVISAHQGDFFAPLALYRERLAAQGIQAPEPVPANYEPAWCSWGYGFDVKPEEMTGVLPVLKDLNIKWLTLDDRWFDAYGDWKPRKETFPNGAEDMRRMNDKIHKAGAYSQLWWYPLCVEDGIGKWESHRYQKATLFNEHNDWIILNADGSVARNNRRIAMLCPALPEVQEHIRELTLRFIRDWGFDGHKLDNIYTIPACHNPAHHHSRPEESTDALAAAYRIIFETTRWLRPDSVTQICQTVTADPTSSAQIRQRIKFYKALMGPEAAVFADHVELSDNSADFASEVGTGGVISTKFIWPDDEKVKARLKEYWNYPPEKQKVWKKWFDIYNTHRPSQGEYLNLYDFAFDKPETHAIRKEGRIYYAFYSQHFSGKLELRGLEDRPYRIVDYVNDRELGMVNGGSAWLDVAFDNALLVMAIPAV